MPTLPTSTHWTDGTSWSERRRWSDGCYWDVTACRWVPCSRPAAADAEAVAEALPAPRDGVAPLPRAGAGDTEAVGAAGAAAATDR